MKLFVGLGNPGSQYQWTRHNAGFLFADKLAEKLDLSFKFNKKFQAELASVRDDLFILKPQVFMNRSGQSVRAFLDFLKIKPDSLNAVLDGPNDLVVAHDDLDLALGDFKLQKGKGPKAHNGLQSIYQHLGNKDFWHLRLGVDSRLDRQQIAGADYVLQPLSATERQLLDQTINQLLEELV